MLKRFVMSVVIVLITGVLFASTAQAYTQTINWRVTNSSSSITGAIFHKVKYNNMYGKAVVREPASGYRTINMNITNRGSAQYPFGLKVWQPAGTCLKTYDRLPFIWLRTHSYKKQSYGRDVWVTKGLSDTGDRLKVRIFRC